MFHKRDISQLMLNTVSILCKTTKQCQCKENFCLGVSLILKEMLKVLIKKQCQCIAEKEIVTVLVLLA